MGEIEYQDLELRTVMDDLELLSVVALLEDHDENGLRRGQVGTVVERLAPGVYEVDFCNDKGESYASVALSAKALMQLHHEPSHQAA